MAGHEVARNNLACLEAESVGRAIKYWRIGASAGDYNAMHTLRKYRTLKQVLLVETQLTIDSTLKAYNSSCAKMRSEARDASILAKTKSI